jgi:hypothetical protein
MRKSKEEEGFHGVGKGLSFLSNTILPDRGRCKGKMTAFFEIMEV